MEGVIKNAAKSEATQLIVAKAVAMSVLGLASFTIGLLPIKLTKLLNLKADGGKNLVISLLLCFGGGVLLFTTFLHLQPEVRESFAALEAEDKIPEIGHGIQMAELVFCLGFFLVYVIEEVVHMCLHRKPNDDTLHRSLSVRYKDNKKENLTIIPRVTLNKFDDGNISYISTSNKKLLTSQTTINFENGGHNHSHMVNLKNSFSGLLTVVALSFHAVFEGLAVGLEDSVQKVWYLFMAIATHKLVIAFCVGVELASSKTKAFLIILYMGTFAIVTPLEIFKSFNEVFIKDHGNFYKIFVGSDIRLAFAKPELMETILSSNVHITKSDGYDLIKPWLGDGLLVSTGMKWKSRRKMITPTFHFKILDQFMDIFNSAGEILVKKLDEEVGKDSVNVFNYVNLLSLDIICETAMGVKINAQENENVEYVAAVRGFLEIMLVRFFSSWQRFDVPFRLASPLYKNHIKHLKKLHEFSNEVIKRRRQEIAGRKQGMNGGITSEHEEVGIKRKVALLDMLLESEMSNKLSNEDLREEIDTFMFEGHDTTTSGISFALLALADNPDVQRKVHEEIVAVIGDAKDIPVTMQHLQDMKYLDMFLKEAQRYYPSVPLIERRLEADCTIEGYTCPKGATISLLIYAMHHCAELYPDPEVFDPNRFTIENQSKRHNYAYVPFSAGSRNCIGQKFAVLEMKAAVIKIVRHFKLLQVPNFKPDLGMAAILKSHNGVCVKLQRR